MDSLREEISKDKTIVADYIHPHSINNGVPTEEILPPKTGGDFPIDEAVLEGTLNCQVKETPYLTSALALPIPGTKLQAAYHYGSSLWW